jgi:hypothetical protein
MRDNTYLSQRLQYIRYTYFPDVPVSNTLHVRFGRACRNRLGSIIARPDPRQDMLVTTIRINALFKQQQVPELVIDATLAHEFAHYTHGFHSPLPKRYTHPHRGGVVERELRTRGAGTLLEAQEQWLKEEYVPFLRSNRML